MKTLRTTAAVYDTNVREYVKHNVDIEISDKLADMLAKELNRGLSNAKIIGHSDGTRSVKNVVSQTPLKNEKRFVVSQSLLIFGDGEEPIGGFTNF